MAEILNFPENARMEEEASHWLVRLDNGPLSDEEAQEFRAWLEADAGHRNMMVELCHLWDNMEILSELSELFPLSRKTASISNRPRIPVGAVAVTTAAAAATIILVVVLLFQQQPGMGGLLETDAASPELVYQTRVGGQKEVSLADGSVIRLNTDSLVSIEYTEAQRNLHLIRGEAHFKVAHDRKRPFIVHAGGGMVRAVGTAFSVRLKGPDVEVTVTEGRVEIASSNEDHKPVAGGKTATRKYMTTLDAGQTAEYDDMSIRSVNTVEPEIISRKLAWQHGTLVFKGETLEQVVKEISRYTDTSIVISDPDIRDMRIGGYFKTGEIDALLTVLQDNFDLHVERVDDNLIYLTEENVIQADKSQ